jgi:zinc protease
LFNEQKQAALYMNHNYGIPVIGWMHELEKLNFEDAVAFYKRHYAPNNAILVVAGDVTPAQVKILAEQYYGAISENLSVKPRQRTQEPPQRSARRMTYYDERVAQPYVSRIYLAPERDRGDQKTAAALVYLAEILGGSSATSILGKELQFKTQKAVYTGAYYSGVSLDNTTFGLIAVPVSDVSLQEVEDAMDSAIAGFMKSGIDLETFERIKLRMRASEIYAMDNVQGIANRYGAALTQGLTISDVQDWPRVLQAVTTDEVMAAARLVFDQKASVTGWLMSPKGESE